MHYPVYFVIAARIILVLLPALLRSIFFYIVTYNQILCWEANVRGLPMIIFLSTLIRELLRVALFFYVLVPCLCPRLHPSVYLDHLVDSTVFAQPLIAYRSKPILATFV